MVTALIERLRGLVDTVEVPDLPPLSEDLVRSLDLPADLTPSPGTWSRHRRSTPAGAVR
jgi:hypothetical protein